MGFRIDEDKLAEFAKRVDLLSSRVLEGLHRSKRGGEGLEFHGSQAYAPGDDLRRIDWKRYGATERLYIRRFDREEKIGWDIILDRSASMHYRQKWDYLQLLAGCLLFIFRSWGDSWSLCPDIKQIDEAIEALLINEAGVMPSEFHSIRGRKENNAIVISDFFFDESQLTGAMKFWREEYRHVHFIQVLEPLEKNFDFNDVYRFEDLESSGRLTVDARRVRKLYLEELERHQAFLKEELGSFGVFQVIQADEAAAEEVIIEFFENVWKFSV